MGRPGSALHLAPFIISVITLAIVVGGASAYAAALVTTSQLADGAVTSAKIRDDNISSVDIRTGTVTTSDLRDGSIQPVDLGAALIGRTSELIPEGFALTRGPVEVDLPEAGVTLYRHGRRVRVALPAGTWQLTLQLNLLDVYADWVAAFPTPSVDPPHVEVTVTDAGGTRPVGGLSVEFPDLAAASRAVTAPVTLSSAGSVEFLFLCYGVVTTAEDAPCGNSASEATHLVAVPVHGVDQAPEELAWP